VYACSLSYAAAGNDSPLDNEQSMTATEYGPLCDEESDAPRMTHNLGCTHLTCASEKKVTFERTAKSFTRVILKSFIRATLLSVP
jgi:hypothetical protein